MIDEAGTAPTHPKHDVQFYENDEYLIGVVAQFLRDGLTAGDPLFVIATPEHRETLAAAIKKDGFDVEQHVRAGDLTFMDAESTLGTFMVSGMPDRDSFRRHVGGAIDKVRAGRSGITVRAFGEMVDLLWRQGKSDAASRGLFLPSTRRPSGY